MLEVIVKKRADDAVNFALLALGDRICVHVRIHEGVEEIDRLLHVIAHLNFSAAAVFNEVEHDRINPLTVALAAARADHVGNVLGAEYSGADGVVKVVIYVRYAVGKANEEGFKHYEQSLRVVDILERDGRGLNLCYETRMGILHHTHGAPDDTTEATVVRLSDRIAYINHDLDDTIRAGILREEDVPEMIRTRCGERNSERINSIMLDLIENSGGGVIKMSDYMQEAVDFFHAFMYSDVYTNPIAKGEESKVDGIIGGLFDYYTGHPEKMPDEMQLIADREGVSRAVCDYISGMTDGYAMEKFSEAFIPMSWTVK